MIETKEHLQSKCIKLKNTSPQSFLLQSSLSVRFDLRQKLDFAISREKSASRESIPSNKTHTTFTCSKLTTETLE